jgi:hypothetical protein
MRLGPVHAAHERRMKKAPLSFQRGPARLTGLTQVNRSEMEIQANPSNGLIHANLRVPRVPRCEGYRRGDEGR